MDKVIQRYHNDATFHAVVDAMLKILDDYQLSPSEMRDAVMLASINFEQRRCRTTVLYGESNSI